MTPLGTAGLAVKRRSKPKTAFFGVAIFTPVTLVTPVTTIQAGVSIEGNGNVIQFQ